MMWNYYTLTAKGELDKAKTEVEKCKQIVESRKNPDEEMFFKFNFCYLLIPLFLVFRLCHGAGGRRMKQKINLLCVILLIIVK